ncbi:cytochrome b5 [Trypanosoma grayi]|uniref:cytochrome b5 n=1 Tax=Trypanosoma grayi TaxID=71804 RepID=UPI0004F48291|nr:cytochrome b5 [Trypanosoma grayi]KEG13894.1 cytochrome b5 [Trypanosoma grayi]
MFDSLLRFVGFAEKWPTLTMDEVRQHNDRFSLWIVAGDSVYDVTSIVESHPGGASALLRRGGGVRDCTEDYYYHSRATRKAWKSYKIGVLSPEGCDKFEEDEGTCMTSSPEGDVSPESSPVNHACAMRECDGGGDCCCTSTVETRGSTSEPVPERRCVECSYRQPVRLAAPPLLL